MEEGNAFPLFWKGREKEGARIPNDRGKSGRRKAQP